MGEINVFKRLKKYLFLGTDEYSIKNQVLIHMLHITFCLSIFSAVTNSFLGLPISVIYGTFIAMLIIVFNYWLVRVKKHYNNGRRLYLTFVIIMINFLWLETGGSTGPTLFYILAFLPLFTFLVDNKRLIIGYIIVGINIPILLVIEGYYPHLITTHPTNIQRILDILVVCFVFVLFEIPLIIHVKSVVIKQRNAARKSEKIKTSYITHLSHEIRTPMNAILGFTELLEQNDLNKDDRHHYISIINDNGHTLLNLLNNIINISKIEEEQTKISLSNFSPFQLLKRIQASLSFKVSDEVDFYIDVTENRDITIESDAILLYQIISNLTFNALKFTSKGYVRIGYYINGAHIYFFVEDTGIGICQSKHSNLFKQFEQFHKENKLLYKGSGLGLTISKSLTHNLKGKLTFESEKDIGSTFYLKLHRKFPNHMD